MVFRWVVDDFSIFYREAEAAYGAFHVFQGDESGFTDRACVVIDRCWVLTQESFSDFSGSLDVVFFQQDFSRTCCIEDLAVYKLIAEAEDEHVEHGQEEGFPLGEGSDANGGGFLPFESGLCHEEAV